MKDIPKPCSDTLLELILRLKVPSSERSFFGASNPALNADITSGGFGGR